MDGKLFSPDRLHERGAANGSVHVKDQSSQDRALATRPQHDDLAVVTNDVDPAQNPKQHAGSVTRIGRNDLWALFGYRRQRD
jgi:hypothetical protein